MRIRPIPLAEVERYIASFQYMFRSFMVEEKRSMKTVYINNECVLRTESNTPKLNLPDQKVRSFFGQVTRSFNSFLKKNEGYVEPVLNEYSGTFFNSDVWDSMQVSDEFYIVDINRCYWTIAWQLGYISKRMFLSAVNNTNPVYKDMCNRALACVKSVTRQIYYKQGVKKLTKVYDKSRQQIMYDNIRFTAFNLLGKLRDLVGEERTLGYTIDGIKVFKEDIQGVCDYFDGHNFNYTIELCKKADDGHFYNTVTDAITRVRRTSMAQDTAFIRNSVVVAA